MSVFNDLQIDLIEKPTNTNYYHRILNEQKKEKKTEKQKRKEMREKLWPVEYKKRYDKQRYKKQRDLFKQRYEEHRDAFNKGMLNEIIDELWPGNDLTDWDKLYTKKFKEDDAKGRAYRFSWRCSRLRSLDWSRVNKQTTPFRVANRKQMNQLIRDNTKTQNGAYEYLKPHMNDIKDCMLALNKNQLPYNYPVYVSDKELRDVVNESPVNIASTYLVFDAMRRWKYMLSEMYLWRNSFILGDVLVTGTGNLFRIALNNNLSRLTKDTVEEIHQKRMAWIKSKSNYAPPIYIVNDAYLIKVHINEREDLFYIVPT